VEYAYVFDKQNSLKEVCVAMEMVALEALDG
jgi:hypothetical protein